MTTAAGYPDWQHIDTKVGLPFAFDQNITISTNKVYGAFYVGNYPAVQVAVQVVGVSTYQTEMDWSDTQAFTSSIIGQNAGVAGGGGALNVVYGVAAPWCRFTVTAEQFTVGDKITVSIVPTFIQQSASQLADPVLLDSKGATINAGASRTFGPGRTAAGPARLMISTACPAGEIQLLEESAGGLFTEVWDIAIGAGGMQQVFDIVLSRNPTELTVFNNDASAHQFWVRLGTEL